MSGHLPKLPKDRVIRRAVDIKGQCVVLWYRWSVSSERWETCAARKFAKRRKLRWRPLSAVLWDGYHLDLTGQQIPLEEIGGVARG